MTPTAVSQVLESLIKLFVGIALALYFLKTTGLPELGAAGAIPRCFHGSFFAVLYILLYYFRNRAITRYSPFEPKVSSVGEILKSILTFAVPVIIGSAFLSALDIVDSSVMMYRLQGAAGVDANSAHRYEGAGSARRASISTCRTPSSCPSLPSCCRCFPVRSQKKKSAKSTVFPCSPCA